MQNTKIYWLRDDNDPEAVTRYFWSEANRNDWLRDQGFEQTHRPDEWIRLSTSEYRGEIIRYIDRFVTGTARLGDLFED